MGIFQEVNFKIKGQVKDETGGLRTYNTIEAELNLIAAKYGLEVEECYDEAY